MYNRISSGNWFLEQFASSSAGIRGILQGGSEGESTGVKEDGSGDGCNGGGSSELGVSFVIGSF